MLGTGILHSCNVHANVVGPGTVRGLTGFLLAQRRGTNTLPEYSTGAVLDAKVASCAMYQSASVYTSQNIPQ